MIVTSHILIEQYEVAFHTEEDKKSLVTHLVSEGFKVENEWLAPLDNEIGFYVKFVRIDKDLLNG